MICTEFDDAELLARIGHSEGPRTTGVVHVSDIYKKLMKRLQPRRFTDAPMDMEKVEVGLLFETALEIAMRLKYGVVRPGEVISDEGIFMSPDGVNPTLGALEEYKSTYISSREGIVEAVEVNGATVQIFRDKFFHWGVQIKAYLKWLGVRSAILRVLFICGDYNRPISPQFKSYRLEFTDQEIENNWAMLIKVAREERLIA